MQKTFAKGTKKPFSRYHPSSLRQNSSEGKLALLLLLTKHLTDSGPRLTAGRHQLAHVTEATGLALLASLKL